MFVTFCPLSFNEQSIIISIQLDQGNDFNCASPLQSASVLAFSLLGILLISASASVIFHEMLKLRTY